MVPFFGDYDTTETVYIPFNTFSSDDPSASVTITNLAAADVEIHKDGGTTQRASDAGVTVTIDFDSVTGNHMVSIDLSDNSDAGFYAAGSRYQVRMEGTTVDGATINAWIGSFSIGCTLRPATAGRTVVVDADGLVDANTVKIGPSGSGTAQTANDVGGDVNDILTDTNELQTDDIPGTLSTIDGKIDVIDGIVDDILVDTGTTLDGKLDTIDGNVDSVPSDVWGTFTEGNINAGTFGEMMDTILGDTNEVQSDLENGGRIDALIDGIKANTDDLADGARLDLIFDAILAMLDDARGEPGQNAPPVNPDAMTKIDYLYKAWRNRTTSDSDSIDLYNDDGSTVGQTASLSDDGSTFTKGEYGTGA